jgi:hypothetical protein
MGPAPRLPSVLLAVVAVLAPAGCDRSDDPSEEEVPVATIQDVKDAHADTWMALPGVVGVGIGLCGDEECIRVLLARPSPEAEDAIPDRVGGYPVDLEVTGAIRPRTPPDTGA